ncbi:unnamed protein product [Symbiodinium sp. CCMP2456]|nr:unnamed protein product [Symbiodinium sp. CCMP2456]
MGPVLARYGFTPDKKGSTELRAVIADLANKSKEIRLMNTEIQKLVISNFPDLRGDKVSLQKSGTPGSTAASTAPPSADEEEPSGESPVSDGSRPEDVGVFGSQACRNIPRISEVKGSLMISLGNSLGC